MLDPNALIEFLNGLAPEFVWVLMLLACFGAILLMLRAFGEVGLYTYVAVAVIGANIQVLKAVQFSVYSDPVALGTILFSSTYLCTDILAEHYGRAAARRAVWVGFSALLLFNVTMILNLGFAPLTAEQAGESMAWALPMHRFMSALFTPAPALFAAGMIAYFISQFHDIWLFQAISKLTKRRHLWLRNNASTWVSALIDNAVFSVLAWVVFAADPIGWQPLIFTFILGTYLLRLLIALVDTPFVYLARYLITPPRETAAYA